MELLPFLRTQVRANRLANHRLHAAMAALSRDEFHAPRVSFFPSLAQTLNHILSVDIISPPKSVALAIRTAASSQSARPPALSWPTIASLSTAGCLP